jgi:hypothetical protein
MPGNVPERRPARETPPADDTLTEAIRPQAADGLAQAIDNASRDWWFQGAVQAVTQLAMSGRGFTVDQVAQMVGEPPDHHYWGALFAAAQRRRICEPVGARLGSDGRLVRVWWGLAQ